MRVTLTDGRSFELDTQKTFSNIEMIAIERTTGWSLEEFQAKLKSNSVLAVTAYVWVLAKRVEPTLRFDDVVFDMDALDGDDPAVVVAEDPKETAASA